MRVQILNGILNGDDMAHARAVNAVNHAGERGALAAARRARNQNQPAAALRQIDDQLRNVQRCGIRQAKGHGAHGSRVRTALAVGVAAEARTPFQRKGKVVVAVVTEQIKITISRDFIRLANQRLRVGRHQTRLLQGLQHAHALNRWLRAGNNKDVCASHIQRGGKQFSQFHSSSSIPFCPASATTTCFVQVSLGSCPAWPMRTAHCNLWPSDDVSSQ